MSALGRYELLLELARGGMAELFLARLRGAGGFEKLVAIKRILPQFAQDRQFTEMFLQEGRIASRLTHPNICQVFELDEHDGQLFLAMEYLEGAPWSEVVVAARPDPRLVAAVLAQAAEGLHDAHSLRDLAGNATPIVHRDVSPQNIFVTIDGVAKVLDFGVSKMMTDGPRTAAGVVKGKLPYMAPEQIRGDVLDGRADVFALGACAWEALAGQPLFHRATDFAIWKAITEEPIPTVSSRWPQCSPALDAVVMRALARVPAERPQTAKAFADELRGAAGFASAAEIADALRATCGQKLAARAQQVAIALARRDSSPSVGDARATLSERRSGPMARDAAHGDPADEDAAATTDMRRQQAVTAPAIQLRDHSVVVHRATPTSQSAVADPRAPAAPRGSHVRTAIIAGGIAAVVTAVVVIVVVGRGRSSNPPPKPDPVVRSEPTERGLGDIDRLRNGLEDMRSNLEAMRDRLHGDKPQTGTLVIASDGATKIYSNDKLLGETPLKVELAPGTYPIRAVHADGRERSWSVEIAAGQTTTSDRVKTW